MFITGANCKIWWTHFTKQSIFHRTAAGLFVVVYKKLGYVYTADRNGVWLAAGLFGLLMSNGTLQEYSIGGFLHDNLNTRIHSIIFLSRYKKVTIFVQVAV